MFATENAGVSSGGASLDEIFVGDIKDMPTLAVSEIKKENLTVYPNPTSDYVYWAGGKADVKVYDLAGNCIKDLTESSLCLWKDWLLVCISYPYRVAIRFLRHE